MRISECSEGQNQGSPDRIFKNFAGPCVLIFRFGTPESGVPDRSVPVVYQHIEHLLSTVSTQYFASATSLQTNADLPVYATTEILPML